MNADAKRFSAQPSRVLISPSILSADFMNLGEDVETIAAGGADWIHVDVMDGHFVPNLTIGPMFVKKLKDLVDTPLDVHLMIDNPEEQIEWYLDAGADLLTIHVETVGDPRPLLSHIRKRGALCGISLNPETSASSVIPYLEDVDLVLVMSVHPGFSGQSFIEDSLAKTRMIRESLSSLETSPVIEVDGGIGIQNAESVIAAGADMLVAGSAVFSKDDPVAAMNAIRAAGDLGLKRRRG